MLWCIVYRACVCPRIRVHVYMHVHVCARAGVRLGVCKRRMQIYFLGED